MKKLSVFLCLAFLSFSCTQNYDVLVVGGGASGTSAAIQSARLGAKTLLVEETPWLGGMLTSAGVSATDGCYNIRGGIYGEFCDSLAARYGGYDKLKTGWVSNIMFQPRVGEQVFENMAAGEKSLTVRKQLSFVSAKKLDKGWKVSFSDGSKVRASVMIDGTELGDIAKYCGVRYHIGEDARSYTGEAIAHEEANDIIQDMTYVLTVKNFGPGEDRTIPMPEGYDRLNYVNCCLNPHNTPVFEKNQQLWPVLEMLTYGQLPGAPEGSEHCFGPGAETMLNWPVEANDFYANIIDATPEERAATIQAAKNRSLGYLYFIQTELGMPYVGISDCEYPTEDGLPFFPYYRESRRIEGETLFTVTDAADPYSSLLYRTGIAVGDYPVDHHHFAHPDWKNLPKFFFSKIPSFTVPLGVLIPKDVEDLIVAEKSISVTNIMNGSTRLQPVVVELGQAAGVLAARATGHYYAGDACEPGPVRKVSVREVQRELLAAGARLQPYLDLKQDDDLFEAAQRIGCTGILRGEGRQEGWSNQMWLRVDEPLRWCDLYLEDYCDYPYKDSDEVVTAGQFAMLMSLISDCDYDYADATQPVSRREAIYELDSCLDPFGSFDVTFSGEIIKK